jgi:hypothetical protein
MGPPPQTSFSSNLHTYRPSYLTLGHPFLYLHTHPKSLFIHLVIVQSLSFQYLHSFLSPLATFFSYESTHVALGSSIHSVLPLFTSSINPDYPIVHIPMISMFVHLVMPLAHFNPRLVAPLTLDSVSQLLPLILYIHP